MCGTQNEDWYEGYEAYWLGTPFDLHESDDWQDGWIDAESEAEDES